MKIKKNKIDIKTKEEEDLRSKVNGERLEILQDYKDKNQYITRLSEAFIPKWYKFTKEIGHRIFSKSGWGGRYFYARITGTGQIIASGGAFSFGPSWGVIVITLPVIELTLGYIR